MVIPPWAWLLADLFFDRADDIFFQLRHPVILFQFFILPPFLLLLFFVSGVVEPRSRAHARWDIALSPHFGLKRRFPSLVYLLPNLISFEQVKARAWSLGILRLFGRLSLYAS